jgi:hypothetical protein
MASVKQRVEYDPSKNYEWSPDMEITLTGREFEALVNSLNVAQSIAKAIFLEGVKSGLIVEAKPEKPEVFRGLPEKGKIDYSEKPKEDEE